MGQKSKNAGKKKSKPSSDKLSTKEMKRMVGSKLTAEIKDVMKEALTPMSIGPGMKTRKSDITALV